MGTAVATGTERSEPVLVHSKPAVKPRRAAQPATSDEFDSPALSLQWQWQANPRAEFFSLRARPGSLRLACLATPDAGGLYHAPNLLLRKFPAPAFTATTALAIAAAADGDEAGLIVFGYSYASIGLRKAAAGVRLVQVATRTPTTTAPRSRSPGSISRRPPSNFALPLTRTVSPVSPTAPTADRLSPSARSCGPRSAAGSARKSACSPRPLPVPASRACPPRPPRRRATPILIGSTSPR